MSAQAINKILLGPPEGQRCALRYNCDDYSHHLSQEGTGGEMKCCCVSKGEKSVFFLCIGSLSELKIHVVSNWKCNLLEEMCKSVNHVWKWESSPRAGNVTAHDKQRKEEMSPTQIRWGKEKPGRTMTFSPSLRIGDAAIHRILIVSKQPGAM